MRKRTILLSLILLLTTIFAARAQDDSGYTSTVNWFYSACEDRMVMDFNGIMQAGYDLYYQAFDLFGGLGEAITELRRVIVDGEYSVSEVTYWLDGETRARGTPISVVIRIGRKIIPIAQSSWSHRTTFSATARNRAPLWSKTIRYRHRLVPDSYPQRAYSRRRGAC